MLAANRLHGKTQRKIPRSVPWRSGDHDLESLRQHPSHGYALVQHIQERSNNLLQVEEGSLYPALQRLLKANLVTADWTISPSTNRRVRIYQMTRAGLRHLDQEISSFDRMLEGIQMVLGPARRSASS
jgi:PadR family transcriptional regulator, regulatory protein PadR